MLVRAIRLTERFSQFWATNRTKSQNVRRRGPVAPILTLSFAGPGSPDYRPGSSADGSAPALGAGGRGFKSRLPDHRPTTTPAGVAQWLESQPSKLAMRVRFPSPAPHVSAGQAPFLARADPLAPQVAGPTSLAATPRGAAPSAPPPSPAVAHCTCAPSVFSAPPHRYCARRSSWSWLQVFAFDDLCAVQVLRTDERRPTEPYAGGAVIPGSRRQRGAPSECGCR